MENKRSFKKNFRDVRQSERARGLERARWSEGLLWPGPETGVRSSRITLVLIRGLLWNGAVSVAAGLHMILIRLLNGQQRAWLPETVRSRSLRTPPTPLSLQQKFDQLRLPAGRCRTAAFFCSDVTRAYWSESDRFVPNLRAASETEPPM